MARRIALCLVLSACGLDSRGLQRSQSTSTVSGAVCSDTTKRFVPGVEVTLLEHDANGVLLSQRLGTTDEQGRFSFERVGNGAHELRFSKGELQQSQEIKVLAGKDLSLPVPDCRLPSGGIKGRICDVASGDWVRGANVSVTTPDGTILADAPTDNDGAFHFREVPSGPREVVAEKMGKRIVVPAIVPGEGELDLGVSDCVQAGLSNLEGQICANATPIWLSGAKVSVVFGTSTISDATDDKGKFRLRGLPAGDYSVTVKKGVYEAKFTATTNTDTTTVMTEPICTSPDLPVAIVSGYFDRVQRVMRQLQFANVTLYKGYPDHDPAKDLPFDKDGSWSAQLLDGAKPEIMRYKMAMFNGGVDLADLGADGSSQRAHRLGVLRDYVLGGGVIYVSDWANELLLGNFGAPISFSDAIGSIQQVYASVMDNVLATKLGAEAVDIGLPRDAARFIGSMTAEVKPYLRATVRIHGANDQDDNQLPMVPLVVSFPYGEGRGVYTSIPSDRQPNASFNQVVDHVIFDL